MLTFSLHGAEYAVEMGGRRGLPALLLLHGFTGSSANWLPHIPALSEGQYVLAPDVLGHGRSASPLDSARYQMSAVAADLIALLDELGIGQTDLLGYSMGGRLALYTAVHYPQRVRRLVLESSSPGLAHAAARAARRQQDEALADWIETHGMAAFVDRWEALPLWESQKALPPEQRAALRARRLQNNPAGLANSLRGMGTGAQPALWQRLPALKAPALLLAGELDAKFVRINQQMAQQISSARLAIVPGAGHTVHLERPLLFRQLVLEFLREEPA